MDTSELLGDDDLMAAAPTGREAPQEKRQDAKQLLTRMAGAGCPCDHLANLRITEAALSPSCSDLVLSLFKLMRKVVLVGLSAREANQLKRKLKKAGKSTDMSSKRPRVEAGKAAAAEVHESQRACANWHCLALLCSRRWTMT